MAKSSQKVQQLFLSYLREHPGEGISAKIFNSIAKTNSRTVFLNVRKDLEDYGYEFESYKIGKEAFYRINNLTSLATYEVASPDDFYKYIILETLNLNRTGMLLENPINRADRRGIVLTHSQDRDTYPFLMDHLYDIEEDPDDYDLIPINIKESKFRTLLAEMVTEGSITATNEPLIGTVYRPNNTEEVFSTQALIHALQILEQIPEKHKNYPILSSAKDKISVELSHKISNVDENPNYIVYGRKHTTFSSIMKELSILSGANYKKCIIHITYTENGQVVETDFAVGKVVFSEISGETYFLGKRVPINEKELYSHIPLSALNKVDSTSSPNLEYNKVKYSNFIHYMLDISVKEPVPFEATFATKYLNTERKLRRLTENRGVNNHTQGERIHPDELTYTDEISDFCTLKSYLLGFGRACVVKAPNLLAKEIKYEIEQALKNYQQEGFDVQ